MHGGRRAEFHTIGPCTVNAQWPTVSWHHHDIPESLYRDLELYVKRNVVSRIMKSPTSESGCQVSVGQ